LEEAMNNEIKVNQYGKIILWLLTIPDEELSDTMLIAKQGLENDIAFIEFLEKQLIDEIEEFAEWNNQMAYSV
jgi:O-phosphoseryl-tRNA(Cys) synthetase